MEDENSYPDPLNNRIGIPPIALERFLAKIDRNGPNGCWIWKAHINTTGYGHFRFGEQGSVPWRAHRLSYSLALGPIPEGRILHHTCNRRECVNPAHLIPVTPREHAVEITENCNSYIAAHKTHCIRGHEFTPENTRYTNMGKRVCITCNRERLRKRYAEWRAANPIKPQSPYCPHGHLMEGENLTYSKTQAGGWGRQCRACGRERARRYGRNITPEERSLRHAKERVAEKAKKGIMGLTGMERAALLKMKNPPARFAHLL